jgi:hypothetical protein
MRQLHDMVHVDEDILSMFGLICCLLSAPETHLIREDRGTSVTGVGPH